MAGPLRRILSRLEVNRRIKPNVHIVPCDQKAPAGWELQKSHRRLTPLAQMRNVERLEKIRRLGHFLPGPDIPAASPVLWSPADAVDRELAGPHIPRDSQLVTRRD